MFRNQPRRCIRGVSPKVVCGAQRLPELPFDLYGWETGQERPVPASAALAGVHDTARATISQTKRSNEPWSSQAGVYGVPGTASLLVQSAAPDEDFGQPFRLADHQQ